MDLSDLKGHLVRMFNHSRKFISSLPHGQTAPDNPTAEFQLCGYSWKDKNFGVWKLHFDVGKSIFTFRRTRAWGGQEPDSLKYVAYAGDEDVVEAAKENLISLLRDRGKIDQGSFDMEPFEVLRDLLRKEQFPSIGGPIQLVKIYEHSNAIPVGIYWPDKKSGQVSIFGRPLMDYEMTPWGVIDPDNPERAFPMKPYLKPE
ncbi:MAG: hypothetical protein KUG74_11565 [Rhodobacteraceae bacterium]|nr:hypothetical protein [Paracoccaceae bacterium]